MYGDPEVHPQSEDYWGHVNPIGPRSCYDEGKRVAEALCYAYAKQVNLCLSSYICTIAIFKYSILYGFCKNNEPILTCSEINI